jgi:hypothetical protein
VPCLLMADFVAKVGCIRWMLGGRSAEDDRICRSRRSVLHSYATRRTEPSPWLEQQFDEAVERAVQALGHR